MDEHTTDSDDAEVNREIHRFSMQALALAKTVVDGTVTDDDQATARALAERLPALAAKSRELADAYRVGAAKALADARLDLAYVAAGGGIPSSLRLGWYIKERDEAQDPSATDAQPNQDEGRS